ncbi:MAG: hypothetical protein OQK75_10285 [Gammaproteobacteria bacterium]|nr:hypothetical protein [Gammaproteobacteria bacterium]MCW8988038.1 hypothetical protein [Gammaproteobacteria bacterium]
MSSNYSSSLFNFALLIPYFLKYSEDVDTLGLDDIKGNKPDCPMGQASVPSILWVQPLPPA